MRAITFLVVTAWSAGCAGPHPLIDGGLPDASVLDGGSSDAGGLDGGSLGDVCASHHAGLSADGDPVEICEQLFASRPWVRPPPDDVSSASAVTLYVAVDWVLKAGSHDDLHDRDGSGYVIVDASGNPLDIGAAATPPNAFPAAMRMPSNRNLFTIYRVQGSLGGPYADPGGGSFPTLQLTDARPAILVRGSAIDQQALGSWEGWASRRIPDGGGLQQFDPNSPVPIRITFASTTPRTNMNVWDLGGATLPDGDVSALVGTIDNVTQNVLGSDGGCFPSLADLADASPFFGASNGVVGMYRLAGMHIAGDQVEVLEYPAGTMNISPSGMGGLYLFGPQSLLSAQPSPGRWDAQAFFPHGTPTGHELHLTRADGGGGGC